MSNMGIKLFGATISISQPTNGKNQEKPDPTAKPEKIIPCPRCKSMETKFCYFNNYNVNQPRHFCKRCQRYWTSGGVLRDVPVGAGRRKNKSPPPLRPFLAMTALSDRFLLDAASQQMGFGEVEEWKAAEHGGLGLFLPAKRMRCATTAPNSQSCLNDF